MPEQRTAEMAWWIQERYAILERRRAGMAPPWTADPVMASVRFCNVHREDDKVTQWIRTHWNQGGDPAWKFVLGRLLNWPDTLQSLLDYADLDAVDFKGMAEGLKATRDTGVKVFSSAYIVSTCGQKMDKIDYVMSVCKDVRSEEAASDGCHPGDSLQDVFEWLRLFDGLGSFLAAQVVADMKNTVGHPLHRAPDKHTFVAWGPGSLKGLSAFWGQNITPHKFKPFFDACRNLVDPLICGVPPIDNQDFQNVCCEFSKYRRVKEGGYARNRYRASRG